MNYMNTTQVPRLIAIFVALVMTCNAIAVPRGVVQISSLSETTMNRSGRLLIFGSGFGSQQGNSVVTIDGINAISTKWSTNEIHVYVPEAASLGTVPVQVNAGNGSSNTVTLNVTLRQQVGRTQWRFQVDDYFWVQFITVAPDGTIYTSDSARLYALSPDGALLWIHENAGHAGPISLGPDGTIYTAGNLVKAINPDGTLRWEFPNQTPGLPLEAGPNLGPDGNIYAIQDSNLDGDGYGVFSLDQNGNLLFTNVQTLGNNPNFSDILFGQDYFFASINHFGGAPTLKAYDYSNGQIVWTQGEMNISGGGYPILDLFGRLIIRWGQIGMQAIVEDGSVDWITTSPINPNILARPTAGSDGAIYAIDWLGIELWAINSDGSTRWTTPTNYDHQASVLSIAPNDAMIVVTGGGDNDGPIFRNWIRGYDPTDGSFIWHVGLGNENGLNEFASAREPKYSPDNFTTYVTTQFVGSANDYGYLYALDLLFDPSLDSDGDGYADADDNCPNTPNADQYDSDEDGIGDVCDIIPDFCADAIGICPGSFTGSTVGATPDGASSCTNFNQLNKDVWFSYTPSVDGSVIVDGCGSLFGYFLSVHTDCPGTIFNEIGCAEYGCSSSWVWPQVTFNSVAGQTYYIRVTGFSYNEIDYTLTLTGPPCASDPAFNPGDINSDTVVDVLDVLELLSAWGPCGVCTADINGDGIVDVVDLLIVIANWS